MTLTAATRAAARRTTDPDRFRLHRAGVLNVWQYDDQEFLLAEGRMLLRGANGAGKSKTLEMLLPFALDGDKSRITASARHHTSLLWLMTDGYDGQARVGYVWVEFLRPGAEGRPEAFTCGVGIRASASARTATAWHFATSQRIGHDLHLEDDGGPLSRPRLEETIGAAGQVFERAASYKEHVGRTLFGLDSGQYDEVLRLLYWLRQPQVGEDIEPGRLADQLAQALPRLAEHAVKAAGDTFDELTAFGEQIERRYAAAESLAGLASAYAGYARAAIAARGRAVVQAVREEKRLRGGVRRQRGELERLTLEREAADRQLTEARSGAERDRARISELEASPEAREQRRLGELAALADQHAAAAYSAADRLHRDEAVQQRRAAAHAEFGGQLGDRISGHVGSLRELDDRQREAAVAARLPVPGALVEPELVDPERAVDLSEALDRAARSLEETRAAAGRRRAAVGVVREAFTELQRAQQRQTAAEHSAEETERRWDDARSRREAAHAEADRLADALADELGQWVADEAAPDLAVPSELTPDTLAALPEAARVATRPVLERHRTAQQAAVTSHDRAQRAIDELAARREDVARTRDPAPPTPPLPRTPRPDGRALWQSVDFAPDLTDPERAGLEAALQDSGLLDAWLRDDGRLLDPDSRDVLLAPTVHLDGATLADVLRPDLPEGCDISAEAVARVLRTIRLGEDVRAEARFDLQGGWRLGPLHGRATKQRAQYVGATARAQERQRRLDEIDQLLTRERTVRDEAAATIASLGAAITAVDDWLRAIPSVDGLRDAWTRADTLREAEQREEKANAAAQAAAHEARTETVRIRAAAEELAVRHDLPLDEERLDALTERLRDLDRDLDRAAAAVPGLRRDLGRWADDARALDEEERALANQRQGARRAEETAQQTLAALEELRATVGSTVLELEQRLAELRESRSAHEQRAEIAETQVRELERAVGVAETSVHQAVDELAAHASRRAETLRDLAAPAGVPGLLDSAGVEDTGVEQTLAAAADLPVGDPVPAATVAAAERLAGSAPQGTAVDPSTVWRAYHEALSGPAADHEPTVATYGDLLAVSGRDDAGECPVERLAVRVGAAVARDCELLTERERQRFEQHVHGELGEAIRRCRTEADELVQAMNELLSEVTTSQGIRVRLDWKLRADVPTEAREAVELLGQPVGALLPEERAKLRDALHRLIEVSRSERPELSYGEHLAAALDYRGWFAFRIRYTRPESAGSWLELHRRSPLSQGEQKVLCYLPLFAAAAAHFTSLAGAAPHAPRLILLDDAFPKIDVRTHPLLFGLLVDLDLDFVITSERLWGDHDTVPALAIYEALRDPSQRGIAQYEYRWDGRQLRSLG